MGVQRTSIEWADRDLPQFLACIAFPRVQHAVLVERVEALLVRTERQGMEGGSYFRRCRDALAGGYVVAVNHCARQMGRNQRFPIRSEAKNIKNAGSLAAWHAPQFLPTAYVDRAHRILPECEN